MSNASRWIARLVLVLCAGAMVLVLGLPLWRPAERRPPAARIGSFDGVQRGFDQRQANPW